MHPFNQRKVMNLQEILTPIAKFAEETFELILVPMSGPFNTAVIILTMCSLAVWLRTMKRREKAG